MRERRALIPVLGVLAMFAGGSGCATSDRPPETDGPTGAIEQNTQCGTECVSGDLLGDRLLTGVNRRRALRSDWAPFTVPLAPNYAFGEQHLRPDVYAAFRRMADAAFGAHVDLYCASGYRSFWRQCELFASYAAQHGCEEANTFSARAGNSEHQLGTVCDIALGATGAFVAPGDPGDVWLRAHAHEYGFACSYPNVDPSLNDGYVHEPWHYRYVGVAAATEIVRRGRPAVPVFIASLSPAELAALEGGGPPLPSSDCDRVGAAGVCTGSVLEWCEAGVYRVVDCATKTDGRTACGPDPNPALGNNCVYP